MKKLKNKPEVTVSFNSFEHGTRRVSHMQRRAEERASELFPDGFTLKVRESD